MSPYKELLKKYHLTPLGYRTIGKNRIVSTSQGDFFIKKKTREDKNNLYHYLSSRSFPYFVPPYNEIEEDEYEIYPWIREVDTPLEQKAIDFIYLLSLLHNKTTFYKEVSLDEIKEIYETLDEKIYYLDHYYHSIQDVIESHIFMSPSEYYLILHISAIYQALYFSKIKLEEWYKIMEEKRSMRYVMVYNNVDLSHLIESDNPLFISWDKAKVDMPINDLYLLYEHLCPKFDFSHLLELYQSKYPLTKEEELLLEVWISIPDKYEMLDNEYQNAKQVYRIYQKIKRSNLFLSKKQKNGEVKNR